MDCLQELQAIELTFNGTLQEMGTILATVEDPMEQMVLAVLATQKYRGHHPSEALNFTEAETVWRVAAEVRKVELNHQEAHLMMVAETYDAALQECQYSHSRSDKIDYSKKNAHLPLQQPGQLELFADD